MHLFLSRSYLVCDFSVLFLQERAKHSCSHEGKKRMDTVDVCLVLELYATIVQVARTDDKFGGCWACCDN